MIKFSILRADWTKKEIEGIEPTDPEFIAHMKSIKNFSSDNDKELLREIDKQYRSDFAGKENFEASAFDVSKYTFKSESSLKKLPEEVL